jgi:hypothetical protein
MSFLVRDRLEDLMHRDRRPEETETECMHVIAGDARCMTLTCGKVRKYDPCAKGMHRRETLIDHLLCRNSIPHAITGNTKDRNGESVSPASSILSCRPSISTAFLTHPFLLPDRAGCLLY